MASYEVENVSEGVEDNDLSKRTPNEFSSITFFDDVENNDFEKRDINSFDLVSVFDEDVQDFTFTKRTINSYESVLLKDKFQMGDFDRLGEFAERFSSVTFSLETESGEPVDEALFLFTPDGFTAVGEVTNSTAILQLLNDKPYNTFYVMAQEAGTENLDYVWYAGEVDPAINPPVSQDYTLTIEKPTLDLDRVIGRGDALQLLTDLLNEEFKVGAQTEL